MKISKLPITLILIFASLLLSYTYSYASTYDFLLTEDTNVIYQTGKDTVLVQTTFTRTVENKTYFFSTSGEKTFHIPDSPSNTDYNIELERQFKIDSLKVTSEHGTNISYSIEELELGEGIYVKVPNYKETKYGHPYEIQLSFNTHDYVTKVNDWVLIQVPGLHKDTSFELTDEASGTVTKAQYNLSVVVDSSIPTLAKIYPTIYSTISDQDNTSYIFKQEDRLGVSSSLEFGTEQLYRFEVKFNTPITDTLIPEKYSSVINALSTNIYVVPLPREFEETNQRVLIERMHPTPTKITSDLEGNIFGYFEVPANVQSQIYISGYIWLEQESYVNKRSIPNTLFTDYLKSVERDINLTKYLLPTIYWETTDPFIQTESENLLQGKSNLLEILEANYTYINDHLEYDNVKAEGKNERIGAKAALQGGASVCMEYADSMIAILRAQGIPSRTAVGYTSLDVLDSQDTDGNTLHQWVQVWIPEYGWLSIDPSYESTNMKIGPSLDTVLWETFFDDTQSNFSFYSADSTEVERFSELDYIVNVYAVNQDTIQSMDTLLSYSDILSSSESSFQDTANLLIKTTSIGKAVILVLPILLILALLILVLSLISVIFKRIKYRKAPLNQQP